MFSPIPEASSGNLSIDGFKALIAQSLPSNTKTPAPMAPSFLCGKKKRWIPDALNDTWGPTTKRTKVSETESFETPSTIASEGEGKDLGESQALKPEPILPGSNLNSMNLGPSKISLLTRELKRRAYSHDEPEVDPLVCRCCRKERRGLQRGLCARCSKGLAKAAAYAGSNGGSAVICDLARSVRITCAEGHQWSLPLAKATKTWCKECWEYQRAKKQEELEALRNRIDNKNIELQAQLFLQAQQIAVNED